MTIPKSYEALSADLASEKILSKTLQGQKESYMMLADGRKVELDAALARDAALRESLTDKRDEYNKLGDRYDAMQQRLTVAEQRAVKFEGLLLRTNELLYQIQGDPGAVPSSAIDAMRGEVFTALKPAVEVEAIGTRPVGCCCPPKGHTGIWAASMCPVHFGLKRPGVKPVEEPTIEVARQSLSFENQRIQPARFHCLACGEYHEGSGNLPCPKMNPMSGVKP